MRIRINCDAETDCGMQGFGVQGVGRLPSPDLPACYADSQGSPGLLERV